MTRTIPGSQTILGSNSAAVEAVLSRILRPKKQSAAAIFLDYTGRGALMVTHQNKKHFLHPNVQWHDLANRSRPVALFQLAKSPCLASIIVAILQQIRMVSGCFFKDNTMKWVAEAAGSLAENGTIGLGALHTFLSNPEVRHWHLKSQSAPDDLEKVITALAWALNFPAVYALSEGPNTLPLVTKLGHPATFWFEILQEHFENCEHQLVCSLVEAAVENALLQLAQEQKQDTCVNKRTDARITVVHLYPPLSQAKSVPGWIPETAGLVRHVAVHKLHPHASLSSAVLEWVNVSATLFVPKMKVDLKKSSHQKWASTVHQEQINSLTHSAVWMRDGKSGETVTAQVAFSQDRVGPAHLLRKETSSRNRVARQKQMTGNRNSRKGPDPCRNLYQILCQAETLRMGWLRAKHIRKDSKGLDGVSREAFQQKLDRELERLRRDLVRRNYRCRPLKRVAIPKADGGTREIGVACIRDRVVFASLLHILEPIFEPGFSRYSFAFRPRRNAHQALTVLCSMIEAGKAWAVTTDIHKCFDSIDHECLLQMLAEKIDDHDLLQLLQHLLNVDVFRFHDILPFIMGVPQGSSLSPLLANIYLDPLDKHFERQGISFVRYADDIVSMADSKDSAEKILGVMKSFLIDPLRLALKPAKTDIASVTDGFEFLGFHVDSNGLSIRMKKLDRIQAELKFLLKQLAREKATLETRAALMARLNGQVRGIRNYFFFNENDQVITEQMRFLDERVASMGNFYLPEVFRNDPIWGNRERFSPGLSLQESEYQAVLGGYGNSCRGNYVESHDAPQPAKWLVKEGALQPPHQDQASHDCADIGDENSITEGIVVDKGHLYVLHHGSFLNLRDDFLVITRKKQELFRRRIEEIQLVFLQGKGINVALSLQLRLAENGTPMVLCPLVGKPSAVLTGTTSANPYLRGQQILRRNDPETVVTGLSMLASKTANQASVLKYFAKYRKKKAPLLCQALSDTANEIRQISDMIGDLDPDSAMIREKAMGYEGQAAAMYWKVLTRLIPDHLEFHGRVAKGAADLVNQCLNYTYGILYGQVWQAVVKAGLDPFFGIMHGAKRDHGSLVFDLIEEFRAPFVDRLVFAMFGRGLQPGQSREGFLNLHTRRKLVLGFIKKWQREMRWRAGRLTPDRILNLQARSLAGFFLRENRYQPFRMRW